MVIPFSVLLLAICLMFTYKQEYIGDITRGCSSLSLEVYNCKTDIDRLREENKRLKIVLEINYAEIEKRTAQMERHVVTCGYEQCEICQYVFLKS